MSIQFKKILICCLFIPLSQHATAEQTPTINFNSMPIGWNNSQVPIAWGDCIPVPVLPIPNNTYPPKMIPPGFITGQYPTPAQGSSPRLPPSNITPLPSPQLTCDNSSDIKLRALQARYNQAAAASRNKIKELTQTLDDIHNQMTDARETIEKLSKKQGADGVLKIASIQEDAKHQMADAKEIIDKLSKELETKQSEITRLKNLQNSNENNRLSLHKELNIAKRKMEERIEKMRNSNSATLKENVKLKAKLLQLEALEKNQEDNRISLHKELDTTKHNMTEQLQRLQQANALSIQENIKAKKEIMRLEILQKNQEENRLSLHAAMATANTAEKEKNQKVVSEIRTKLINIEEANENISSENSMLNTLVGTLENNNKALKEKLISDNKNQIQQKRKLAALSSSTQELGALKKAYKERNEETIKLKKQLASLEKSQNSLNNKLASIKNTSTLKGAQNQATIDKLKKQLANLDSDNKTLRAKLTTFESKVGNQARKLTALGQASTELTAIQSAYKERNDENIELKKQISKFEAQQTASTLKDAQDQNIITDLKKKLEALSNETISLKTKNNSMEKEASEQTRKLSVLNQSAIEFKALQSAYKDLKDENSTLKKQINDLNDLNISLKTNLTSAEKNASIQTRKLTALGQSASELSAVQSAYKERNDEVMVLKTKLSKLDSLQIACTLKGAQNDSTIKNMKSNLAKLSDENKSLKSKLSTIEAEASARARKLTALGKTTTELSALQSAYKERNNEADALKKELSLLKMSYDSDKEKLTILEKALSASKENIKKLKQQLAEQKMSLETTTKACQISDQDLKDRLASSENTNKSLLAKITTLESNSGNQLRKLNALMANIKELDTIKSAYKELTNKNDEISSKLEAATADNDNDGVLNSVDKCPNSPAGSEVNIIGCFADADHDGIANSKDKCPTSPAGSDVNDEGCPKMVDTDGDSVADANDLCPNTEKGLDVNQFGCTANENITLEGVNFATGSARLTADSLPIIAAAAETIKRNPTLKIQIAGYTDNQGARLLNKNLSQRRANSVMIQLIKNGVAADNLSAKGYGEENPVASNNTAEGRATNRRVELKIH